ncbi:uncharacterized protein N0V89_006548 [Didymosphaeria variabile]|uniref:EF-hand domain-containing protein n=1 Tax=Didymosphaeria variabile TaxID=1932322 RepID=A0A9W8XHT4_9PLEO|nr:uncharacterized protein N0V89_006548 [Didymosphaeria variabile]KAJ4351209.1 hypothetical protein N0V89_006548 [Didymosphaeria variabile]
MQNELHQLEMQKSKHVEKQYHILYRIDSICYFDHPEWTPGHKNIVSRIPVKNLDLFLERNKRIVFIVYRDFNIPSAEKENKNTPFQTRHDTQPRPAKESIYPVSRRLRKALEIMLKHDWRYEAMSNHLRQAGEVSAPYLFVYHHRRYWNDMLAQFPQAVREHLSFLATYVSENYGHEYKAADTALAQRKTTAELVKYLFQPGDILLSQTSGQYRGLVANSWPQEIPSAPAIVPSRFPPPMILYPHLNSHRWQDSDSEFDNSDVDNEGMQPNSGPVGMSEEDAFRRAFDRMHPWFLSKEEEQAKTVAAAKTNKEFHIKVWKWSFDGDFKREADKVTLRLSQAAESTSGEAKTYKIHELDIYPLRFAPQVLAQDLRRRGEMFWECRKRCLISYRETSPEAQNESDERFMIDFHTFRKLHPENKSHAINDPAETMSQAEMEQAQPPDEAFYYLVPLQTKGFNLRTKKWLDLNMDQISPVDWNQKAFDSLVLDRKTKELITALVSKQISAAKSTDVIAGKGNGLILLLHGGPGTGKTLTAEGVAEIAKKPLYRVTCGDVGTKAEEVEGYLESVLHLGKIWDCVVLLDEAEVFLERRSLDDLQRNALVSVFLRVIEYHEGILILTSNRVGTFDEAFRSRIQIAVHYPPLRAFQRLQIWRNFFDRLESFKDGTVDTDELRDHLEELQEVEINGRQIRNAITTARQYAEWKGKVMNYEHLKTALDVASKFDDYSEKLRGGLTDDQIAEEEGIR